MPANRNTEFDFIVVGGGSAGCAAAERLIQSHGVSVLLIESGSTDKNPLIHMPAGSFRLLFNGAKEINRFESSPQPSLNERRLQLPHARVLGGGSAVNAMAYLRGTPSDYDGWSENIDGRYGWNWNGMLPYFRAQEGNVRLNDDYHGIDGPWKVSDPAYIVDSAHQFVKTMQSLGVPYRDDFNAAEKFGVGYFQTSTFQGRRCSAVNAFIKPIERSPLFSLLTDVTVGRVLFEKNRAAGVEYIERGERKTAYARGEVVLAAGAMNSPKLLMLSGIGPARQLEKLGIPVLQDVPGVGQNLQDHCLTTVSNTTTGSRGYCGDQRGARMLWNVLQYQMFRSGPIASNGAETQAFIRIGETAEPNVQIYGLGLLMPGKYNPGITPGFSLLANLVRPKSVGRITLSSADPRVPPSVDPNFLSEPSDMDTMVEAIRYLRDVMRTRPLADFIGEEVCRGIRSGMITGVRLRNTLNAR